MKQSLRYSFVSHTVKIHGVIDGLGSFGKLLEVLEVFVMSTTQCWLHASILFFDVSRNLATNYSIPSQFGK